MLIRLLESWFAHKWGCVCVKKLDSGSDLGQRDSVGARGGQKNRLSVKNQNATIVTCPKGD